VYFSRKIFFKIFLIVVLVSFGLWVSVRYGQKLELDPLCQFIQGLGVWAPVGFIGIYIAATVLFLPGSALTIAGGFLFGPVLGVLYNLTGAVVGGTFAFLISRYLASEWVAKKIGGRLKQLIQGVEIEGWKFVAVVRLIPLIPFNLLNYGLGLTKISIKAYMVASAVFMLPGAIAYTYAGFLGEEFLRGGGKELVGEIMLGIGFFVILGVISWWVKKARKGVTHISD